jgi:hypothetical protein
MAQDCLELAAVLRDLESMVRYFKYMFQTRLENGHWVNNGEEINGMCLDYLSTLADVALSHGTCIRLAAVNHRCSPRSRSVNECWIVYAKRKMMETMAVLRIVLLNIEKGQEFNPVLLLWSGSMNIIQTNLSYIDVRL